MKNNKISNIANERVDKNLQALRLLRENNLNIQDDEKLTILNEYTGWGGLRDAIYNPSVYRRLKRYLSDEEITSVKKTVNSAYYTPDLLIKFIWAALVRMGFKGGDILEPAIGTGVFLDHIPPRVKHASNVDAIEIDRVTCNILVYKQPEINLIYSGFENAYFGKKQYDLIISNPPYGREVINDIFYPDLSGLIIHHWFVAKSAKIIKDKGIIAMVVPQFFLDNVKDHARDIIHDEGVNMLAAYRLPDNLFANAQVTVDIVFLQKAKTSIKWLITKNITIGKDRKPMNEYFIDHPEHVLGELQIVPMYDRTGLTCKANGSLRDMLYAACLKIKRLI